MHPYNPRSRLSIVEYVPSHILIDHEIWASVYIFDTSVYVVIE
jgi:hypothetical protein